MPSIVVVASVAFEDEGLSDPDGGSGGGEEEVSTIVLCLVTKECNVDHRNYTLEDIWDATTRMTMWN